MNDSSELLDSLREIAARTYRNEIGIAELKEKQERGTYLIMATLKDVQDAITKEHADVATLVGLVPKLITAVANGDMTSADAQALLDQINPDDSSIGSTIVAIQAALTPTPVTPVTPPATAPASGTPAPVTPTPTGDTSAQ